jgi:hypothetical protein
MKVEIPSGPVHILLFLLLAFLCYQAHQLTRHLVGAALCGGFGTMTFTITVTREPCLFASVVSLSGGLLTFWLAWFGMFLLRLPRYQILAYTLIFASFAHLRFIQTLTGRGDELILAQQWLGISSRAIVAAIIFLIGLPPIIAAFRVIANSRRVLVFICSWLLPLPLLFVMLFANQFLFGTNGDEMQGASILGIFLIVFMTDLIASILWIVFAPRYLHPREEA